MPTQTPMLPGLGGGTGGVQLQPGQLANAATPANIQGSGKTALGTTIPPLSGGAQPGATLPTPQMTNNLAPGGHTTALPGQNAPAGTPVLPGGVGPVTNQPAPTITQMMNTPQMNTPAEFAAKYGTAATTPDQTTATADKYNAAFNAVKNTAPPSNKGEALPAVTAAVAQNTPETTPNPQAQFMDAYAGMNPVVKTMYDNIQTLLSSQSTRTSLVDEFTKLNTDQGLPADKLALMNIDNVMKGTEDDIRNEITKAGGFATNSQVMALTASRNKVLMTQATALQDQITSKEDYVKQIMTLTQADYASADKQVSDQLGLDEKVADMQINLDNAATDNYFKMLGLQQTADAAQTTQNDKTLTSLGGDYTAFASTVPDGLKGKVESLMGLAPGTLSNKDELAYLTASSLKQQQLAQTGQKIQISLNNAGTLDQYRSALTDLAGARTMAAEANTVNSTIKSMYGTATANPITAYRNASIWIGNVNAAYAKSTDPTNVNKGASDLELMDAAVKLNNGGQQITQVQVDALQKSIGLPGKITVEGGKITGYSGILDSGTRSAIRDLATANLIQKRIGANTATASINQTLKSRGVSDTYNLPQLQAAMIPEGSTNTGTAADGMTTVYMMQDGSVQDANGTAYNQDGYPI